MTLSWNSAMTFLTSVDGPPAWIPGRPRRPTSRTAIFIRVEKPHEKRTTGRHLLATRPRAPPAAARALYQARDPRPRPNAGGRPRRRSVFGRVAELPLEEEVRPDFPRHEPRDGQRVGHALAALALDRRRRVGAAGDLRRDEDHHPVG